MPEKSETTATVRSLTKKPPALKVSTNPLAKYDRYKKYLYLDRPKHIDETYQQAQKLESEKTLAELQEAVIKNLRRKAERKTSSTAFLDYLRTREKSWAANKCHSDGEKTPANEAVSSDSSSNDYSVKLSDIKSENESIYWKENRGKVWAEDILLVNKNEKLLDDDVLDKFKGDLKNVELMLEEIVMPSRVTNLTNIN